MRLEDRIAIVTGGGSGIGLATVERFVSEGAAVVVADMAGHKAERVAQAIVEDGGRAIALRADVTVDDDVEAMVYAAVSRFGRLDILFNNAGTIRIGTAVRLSREDWDLVMATNVTSVFLGAKYGVPAMADSGGGSIINTASVSGLSGDRSNVAYNTSKAAVINLTRCLALDHAGQGIRVNAICPGIIATPPVRKLFSGEAGSARAARAHPLGRLGEPDEIAKAAVFLASDDSSFVTGEALVVDGGMMAQHHLPGISGDIPGVVSTSDTK